MLCHAPLVPSPKNGVVQTRSPRSGSPKSPSSLDAPRTCVQRRLTFTHLSPCLSHWPVGPETNHETTSPCNIPFVQHPLHGHHQARLRNSALESRLVTPGTSLRIGYQDGWHGTQMSGILAYTSSAGNQGIEVAFTGAHLGSCQPGNDAEALRRTTRDYTLPTRCRTNPEPRQRVGTSWRLCHTLSVQSGAAVWQRLLSNFKYSCLQPTATNARPLFTPDLLRRVQFLACTACRVAIRLDTLARGGSRARASCTVPRLRVRPLVSHNEDLNSPKQSERVLFTTYRVCPYRVCPRTSLAVLDFCTNSVFSNLARARLASFLQLCLPHP